MNTKVEEKRLANGAIESFSKSKNAQTKTMSKDIVVTRENFENEKY